MKKPVDPIVSFFDFCRARETRDARRLAHARRELKRHGIRVVLDDEGRQEKGADT